MHVFHISSIIERKGIDTFRYIWYISYTRMEVTAMTSADPVEVTAIRIMIHTMNSPVDPIRRCATAGATNPVVLQLNNI